MRIEGCGGCFEDRIYDLDTATAWRIVLVSLNDMDVDVDEVDQAINIVKFHNKDKIMQVAVKAIDADTVHVIMDGTKERLQIYSWKKETEEVETFFKIFETKMREMRSFVICRQCGEKISATAKFCPECGFRMI